MDAPEVVSVADIGDRNDLIFSYQGEAVAGLHFEGVFLEADDGAGDLGAVFQLDVVGARRTAARE